MLLAWSITEIIRYSFYAFSLSPTKTPTPHWLVWLRYSTFYVLYPLGAGSEAALIYSTLPSGSPYPSAKSWVKGLWGPADYFRGFMFLGWFPGGCYFECFAHSGKRS
jgi:very-long-chain (3R)-3-hydroxyacyl-CoA dehydratase